MSNARSAYHVAPTHIAANIDKRQDFAQAHCRDKHRLDKQQEGVEDTQPLKLHIHIGVTHCSLVHVLTYHADST